MFYDQGCIGRVELGPIPEELSERLCAVPGEWLEYDPPSGAVVVRHVEPTSSRHLPAIVHELVRIFAEIPPELHSTIPGGDLFVHTAVERGQLVRVRVEPGGAIRIQWAHPDFKRALRRPYAGGSEIVIDPEVQQLNGTVAFRTRDPHGAARALEELIEGFEGLYPVGNCGVRVKDEGSVELTMEETNLEAVRAGGPSPEAGGAQVPVGAFRAELLRNGATGATDPVRVRRRKDLGAASPSLGREGRADGGRTRTKENDTCLTTG
jgi:hypothetical protein